MATAQSHADTLETLGLSVEALSPKTLAVRAVPTTLADGDPVALARSVLGELSQHEASTGYCSGQYVQIGAEILVQHRRGVAAAFLPHTQRQNYGLLPTQCR